MRASYVLNSLAADLASAGLLERNGQDGDGLAVGKLNGNDSANVGLGVVAAVGLGITAGSGDVGGGGDLVAVDGVGRSVGGSENGGSESQDDSVEGVHFEGVEW